MSHFADLLRHITEKDPIVIIEMRTYHVKPGLRDEFLRLLGSTMVPAQVAGGIKVLGPFPSIDDPDTFFFMRGFPDRSSHETMKATFHNGALWKNGLRDRLLAMLDTYDVVVVEDAGGRVRW